MRAFVVSDDHGALSEEGEVGLENLVGLLEQNNVNMFWHLGDICPKDLSDEGGDGVEKAYRIHGDLIRNLESEGIDYVFVPGNYDQEVAENFGDLSNFLMKPLAKLENSENYGVTQVSSPTEYGVCLESSSQRIFLVHAGLAGETPYAERDNILEENVNHYLEGELLPDSLEANLDAVADIADRQRKNVAMVRGHEEIFDAWKRKTGSYNLSIYTVGAYMHGKAALLEIDDDISDGISFEELDVW